MGQRTAHSPKSLTPSVSRRDLAEYDTPMNTPATLGLNDLLSRLDASFSFAKHGCGDKAAGLNILAAKALIISNLSNSRIVDGDFSISLGTNFIICGARSSVLAQEALRQPIEFQSNLSVNVRMALVADQRSKARKTGFVVSTPVNLDPVPETPTIQTYIGKLHGDFTPYRLLAPSAGQYLLELIEGPLMTARVQAPEEIANCLNKAHSGNLFLQTTINDAEHARRLNKALLRGMGGACTGEPTFRFVSARVAATLRPEVLAASIQGGGSEANWLSKAVWLIDCGKYTIKTAKCDDPPLDDMFSKALSLVMTERADFDDSKSPLMLKMKFQSIQESYMQRLEQFEVKCPGITEAAGNLAASLCYGLWRMRASTGQRASLYDPQYGYPLALHLVEKMVVARLAIEDQSERQRVTVLAGRLLEKLEQEPRDARRLTQSVNKLRMPECVEALGLLEELGFAKQEDRVWLPLRSTAEFTTHLEKSHASSTIR